MRGLFIVNYHGTKAPRDVSRWRIKQTSLDIFREIVEELEAASEQFREIAGDLNRKE